MFSRLSQNLIPNVGIRELSSSSNKSTISSAVSGIIFKRNQTTFVRRVRWSPNTTIQSRPEYYRDPAKSDYVAEFEQTRIIPTLPTFYSRNPAHDTNMANLQDVLNKYISYAYDRRNTSTKSWLTFSEYKGIGGGVKLKTTQYQKLITLLKRLDSINPQLTNDEIKAALQPYRSTKPEPINTNKQKELDDKGRAVAIGRRKASSAKVYLVEGEGKILINDKPLESVFPNAGDRMKILHPLQVVGEENSYNIYALSRGGGSTAQVDSIALGISRALTIFNPLYRKRLFKAGCLTRDPRVVERKKPGRRKARKMPTWVKR